jgi:DNA-binding LytR/AlgR family response regulator
MVVDDDDVDRLTVLAFLENYPFIKITGAHDSALAALTAARQYPPDVLFLDIDMPEMNGLTLRKQLLHIPACVFITSYPEFALDGFELEALDFL